MWLGGPHDRQPRQATSTQANQSGQPREATDGRDLVSAQFESRCDVCKHPVMRGDHIVCDDFGQFVHDRCCL
jgi:hypothetical protein